MRFVTKMIWTRECFTVGFTFQHGLNFGVLFDLIIYSNYDILISLAFLCSQKRKPKHKRQMRLCCIIEALPHEETPSRQLQSANQEKSLEIFFVKLWIHNSRALTRLIRWAAKRNMRLCSWRGAGDEQFSAWKNINIWFTLSCFLFERWMFRRAGAWKIVGCK